MAYTWGVQMPFSLDSRDDRGVQFWSVHKPFVAGFCQKGKQFHSLLLCSEHVHVLLQLQLLNKDTICSEQTKTIFLEVSSKKMANSYKTSRYQLKFLLRYLPHWRAAKKG